MAGTIAVVAAALLTAAACVSIVLATALAAAVHIVGAALLRTSGGFADVKAEALTITAGVAESAAAA